jgi:hypothetical protein
VRGWGGGGRRRRKVALIYFLLWGRRVVHGNSYDYDTWGVEKYVKILLCIIENTLTYKRRSK